PLAVPTNEPWAGFFALANHCVNADSRQTVEGRWGQGQQPDTVTSSVADKQLIIPAGRAWLDAVLVLFDLTTEMAKRLTIQLSTGMRK
ncbi:hypothetical protein BgiBS90_016365, partial [Biomphalaria glabrata]